MTENASPAYDPTAVGGQGPQQYGVPPQQYGAPPQGYGVPPQGYGSAPAYAHYAAGGPLGRPRGTGMAVLLFVVTLGIYSWYWYFAVHDEMKRHTGQGIGGPIALILAVFVGIASPFLASHEVGEMYARAGQPKPVSAVTGLWLALGWVIIVGPVIWFVKTNGALNRYWEARGAR